MLYIYIYESRGRKGAGIPWCVQRRGDCTVLDGTNADHTEERHQGGFPLQLQEEAAQPVRS